MNSSVDVQVSKQVTELVHELEVKETMKQMGEWKEQ